MDIIAFFSRNGIPEIGLTPLITIQKLDGTVVINGAPMTDATNGFYNYNFINYDSSLSYIVIADSQDDTLDNRYSRYGGRLSNTVLSTIETQKIDAIPGSVEELLSATHGKGMWTLGGGSDIMYEGISIEQLNTSVEYIIGKVEDSKKELSENIGKLSDNIGDEFKGLSKLHTDILAAIQMKNNSIAEVNIDYNKIIDSIRSVKSTVTNEELKGDIMNLLDKMDAFKQLDIMEITEAIDVKLNEIKPDDTEVLASIKNNFKDLNNKIGDLKKSAKVSEDDRSKLTKNIYDLLESIDGSGLKDISDRINGIRNKIGIMHEDLLDLEN